MGFSLLIYIIIFSSNLGYKPFSSGQLLFTHFTPKRITINVLSAEDIDRATPKFRIEPHHFDCLTVLISRRLFVWHRDSNSGKLQNIPAFGDHVYFHPNVWVDGWQHVRQYLEYLRDLTGALPRCPSAPKFWEHGVSGSAIHHWPPSFFDHWTALISKGETLSLDPAPPSAIAGPSGTTHSPPPAPSFPHHSPAHFSQDPEMPSSPLSITGSATPTCSAILNIKREMLEDSPLDFLPFEDGKGIASAGLEVDGFELLSIGAPLYLPPKPGTLQPLTTPPHSPVAGTSTAADTGDYDSWLWKKAGPITEEDMATIEY